MKRQLFVLIAGAALAFGATALAHHSQVAVYQTSAEQKIEGKLVQVLIRSPHSWVHIEGKDLKDPTGAVQRFAIEWGGAAQLSRQGVDGKTLKVGDVVHRHAGVIANGWRDEAPLPVLGHDRRPGAGELNRRSEPADLLHDRRLRPLLIDLRDEGR